CAAAARRARAGGYAGERQEIDGNVAGGLRATLRAGRVGHRSKTRGVVQQGAHLAGDALGGSEKLIDADGGTGGRQRFCVLSLVVVARERKWDEDRRPADCAKLGQRARTRASDDQI